MQMRNGQSSDDSPRREYTKEELAERRLSDKKTNLLFAFFFLAIVAVFFSLFAYQRNENRCSSEGVSIKRTEDVCLRSSMGCREWAKIEKTYTCVDSQWEMSK